MLRADDDIVDERPSRPFDIVKSPTYLAGCSWDVGVQFLGGLVQECAY